MVIKRKFKLIFLIIVILLLIGGIIEIAFFTSCKTTKKEPITLEESLISYTRITPDEEEKNFPIN